MTHLGVVNSFPTRVIFKLPKNKHGSCYKSQNGHTDWAIELFISEGPKIDGRALMKAALQVTCGDSLRE